MKWEYENKIVSEASAVRLRTAPEGVYTWIKPEGKNSGAYYVKIGDRVLYLSMNGPIMMCKDIPDYALSPAPFDFKIVLTPKNNGYT